MDGVKFIADHFREDNRIIQVRGPEANAYIFYICAAPELLYTYIDSKDCKIM